MAVACGTPSSSLRPSLSDSVIVAIEIADVLPVETEASSALASASVETSLGTKAVLVLGTVVFGAAGTMLGKSDTLMWSMDLHGEPQEFQRPWAGVAGSLIGMSFVNIAASMCCAALRCHVAGCSRKSRSICECEVLERAAIDVSAAKRAQVLCSNCRDKVTSKCTASIDGDVLQTSTNRDSPQTFLDPDDWQLDFRKKQHLLGLFVAILNLIGTALAYTALLYIPASVWQMLRSASIIFSALLSILFLGAKVDCIKWMGAFVCISGVMIVGLANVLESDEREHEPRVVLRGSGLMLLSQLFMASVGVAEEYLVKQCHMSPTRVVSLEGGWGFAILMVTVYPVLYAFPGDDDGHFCNVFETLALLWNSPTLFVMYMAFILTNLGQNFFGIMVSALWSSVHRRMLDGVRSLLIWISGLSIHYFANSTSGLGEEWTTQSYLEMFGFVLILFGQLLFGGVLTGFVSARKIQ